VRDEAIFIETDAGTWSQLGLTSANLESLVAQRNIIASGGTLDTGDGRVFVKPGGELNAVREIESIIASSVSSGELANQVYLNDLGLTVRRGYEDPPGLIARYGDATSTRDAVIVSLTMKEGASIVDVCEAAKQRVEELQNVEKVLPPDLAVTPISDQSVGVKRRITDVVINMLEAIVIVVIVVYLMVGFRTAAVMAANIPFVVLISVGLITFFDVQLEQISLASIIIALGLLVDNAVQVCDQTRQNQIEGMPPLESAVEAARVVAAPMLGGTLTTIAAFLPMLFAIYGSKREFIYSLPVTLSTILAVSWVVALTFCVILAAAFIRPPADPTQSSAPLPRLWNWIVGVVGAGFQRALRRFRKQGNGEQQRRQQSGWFAFLASLAIRRKFITVSVAATLFVGVLTLPIGSEFFPQNERDQFAVEVWTPENANIEQTDAVAQQVEEIIRKLSRSTDENGVEVQRLRAMRTLVGGGGSRWYMSWNPESRKPNFAEILVRTTDGRFTSQFAERIRQVAQDGNVELGIAPVVDARVVPVELMLGPPADPVAIRVMGNGFADAEVLHRVASRVKEIVRNETSTWNVHDSWGADGYELAANIDEDSANLAGVTNANVASTLSAYYSGRRLTTFREGEHQVPVYFRLREEDRRSLAGVEQVFVEGSYGKVPLNAIANLDLRWGPALIQRRNMNRVIEVKARVDPGVSGNDVVKKVMDSDEIKQLERELPSGYWLEVGGALEESQQASGMMLMSFGISAIMIVLLLVIQYNSVAKAMVIVATLPLALIGALFGLWITGNPLGFMPQLGLLALFGIVLNTAIIYIEFADILIAERVNKTSGDGPILGLSVSEFRECLVSAGKQRLLPIFLTTATTVGGLIPLALTGGPLWEGMTWLMISGLLAATLLTLFVVPALYAITVETFKISPIRLQHLESSATQPKPY
jgi:multidrug efflux pump subunit AcrB